MIFANLLLMGDREAVSGKVTTKFSRDYGAGRLKARMFDAYGLDDPSGYGNATLCIGQGDIVSLPLNGGNALPADVDVVKAVAFWYDSRHELGNNVADVNLRLRDLGNQAIVSNSNAVYDNKERVFYGTAGGKQLALEIVGNGNIDPSTWYHACGIQGKVRVNVAWFYEDSDRDDFWGTPGWNAGTGIGVEPE